jgi:cytochrome P450
LKLVRGQVDTIINARKKELESKKDEGFDETAATDLLGLMLAARDDQGKPAFDNENLVDQVTIHFKAGLLHAVVMWASCCRP